MASKKTGVTLLIDGDIMLYKICSSAESPFYWGDDLWTLHADEGEVREQIDNEIADLSRRLNASCVIIALSGETNWRKIVLPTYKANRKGTRKPVVYKPAKEYVRDVYSVAEHVNLEADDVLGLLATDPSREGPHVIVSADKDLRTVPGYLYNPDKPDQGIMQITTDDADRFHMFQTLVGDSADGYSGCPGVGPKTAAKILSDVGAGPYWPAIVEAYGDANLGEGEALTQARVSRILRFGEYTASTNQVHLWSPNESRTASQPTP